MDYAMRSGFISQALEVLGIGWHGFRALTVHQKGLWPRFFAKMGPFSGSGSTRETKKNSEKQSETCSLVLVVLGKCGREVRKAVKLDSKYWTRSPESSKSRRCYAVGTRWLVSIAICRTIKNLLDNGIRGPDARPLGLLLALHGHIETFSKAPKRLYRLFDAPLNLGPFSSGVLCDRRSRSCIVAPVEALLKPNVSCLGTCRCMLSVMGLCSGEDPICPGVSLDLGGDARVEVEWFVRLSLSSASWRGDHFPIGDVTVLVTFAAVGQGHALFVGAVACDLLRREGWDSVGEFALPEEVGRPLGHGSPCRGGKVKIAGGLPAKERKVNAHGLVQITRYIALEIEKTQVARKPTPWTVVGVGLKACMEA
ncbi:hypothetical protein CRG98_012633 [Punica granatum]|uniref:Uncharacterized protein n=1 Tax=Punica granatum TaxID=22663 RepID=A0A2I0KEN6_PUNGR|nr:hypothetical protein CRG98_012633 [Punica granatum]